MRKVLYVRIRKQQRRGRPRGSTTSLSRRPSVQASVKAVIEEVVTEKRMSIKDAIVDGIESGPRDAERYLRLCAEYTDGKPNVNMHLTTSFKEDEINAANRSLARKMDRLFERAVESLPVTIEGTSIKSA